MREILVLGGFCVLEVWDFRAFGLLEVQGVGV